MSSIKVIDINEEAKPEEAIEEAKEEVIEEVIEEVKEEAKEEVVNELIEKPKTEEAEVKKPEKEQDANPCVKTQDKLITCPKCNKSMKLKSYRYKHEKTCQGTLEQKPVKPFSKPRAKAKALPKPKIEVKEAPKPEILKDISNQVIQPQLSPYDIARQSYIQMKEELKAKKIEKINNFKSKMF